jgi:hypothetical protein
LCSLLVACNDSSHQVTHDEDDDDGKRRTHKNETATTLTSAAGGGFFFRCGWAVGWMDSEEKEAALKSSCGKIHKEILFMREGFTKAL